MQVELPTRRDHFGASVTSENVTSRRGATLLSDDLGAPSTREELSAVLALLSFNEDLLGAPRALLR